MGVASGSDPFGHGNVLRGVGRSPDRAVNATADDAAVSLLRNGGGGGSVEQIQLHCAFHRPGNRAVEPARRPPGPGGQTIWSEYRPAGSGARATSELGPASP